MFKSIIVLCFALLSVNCKVSLFPIVKPTLVADIPQDQEDDEGLYLDGSDVALACTAGTPLGEKMILAFTACSGGEDGDMAETRKGRRGCRGRKCKGKGKKKPSCPSVDSILETIGMEMEGK